MAFNYSPKVITDGLVLYLDAANPKSLADVPATNLLIWSEEFENSTWVKSVANITYNQPDPFGGNEAILCTFNNDGLSRIAQQRAITAGTTYTLSAWIKGVNITQFRFLLGTNQVVFVTSQIINGEWVRVTATVTATTSGNFQQSPARSNNDNGESFYIYGAQLETGTVATTYIPTTSTIASRVPAWNDLSRSGNNGTLTNGPTYSSANGGSIVFDGVNDYVDVADTPFRFSNTFSISFWFYWNGVNQFANILGKRNEVSPFNQYAFAFYESPYTGGSSNKLSFFARRDGGGTDILLQYPLPSSGFYNATVIMSPSNQSLYVNNILRSSSSTDISTFTYNIINKNLWIGSSFGASTYFTGNIPQVSIYNRALSAQEILQNYNATKTRFGL